MGSNLLYKASIVTTPTAYGVGVLNSIKPAQSFSEELLANNNFASGYTSWSTYGVTSVSDGIATIGASASSGIFQTILTQGRKYKVTLNVTSYNGVGTADVSDNNGVIKYSVTSIGVQSFTFTQTHSTGEILFRGRSNAIFSLSSVSVVEITDADFDFTRTSSATRVNPDYLIETVSINSANLVQNGNFSELSNEIIVNGNYDDASAWTISGGNAEISNGKLNFNNAANYGTSIANSASVVSGKTYLVQFTISNYSSGAAQIRLGNQFGTSRSANGTYTEYIVANATLIRLYSSSNNTTLSIDNVSVKQVDPNDNWTLGTGWSYGAGKVIASNTSVNINQNIGNKQGIKLKIQFEVEFISGSFLRAEIGGSLGTNITSSGTYSTTITPTSASGLLFIYGSSFTGSVTNISVIEIQENGVPRLDYTNGTASILLEPQRTNLITYSEDFSQWIPDTNASITSNSIISPDGTQNADKLIAGSSVARQSIKFNLNTTGNISAYVFAKKGEYTVIQLTDALLGAAFANFDLQSGLVGSTNTFAANIENYGNGWFKCSITYNSVNSSINSFRISIAQSSTSARLTPTFAGNGSDGLYIYGAQLENELFSTSLINTSGSTVTRATESLTNAGNSDLINSTEGVLYAEISALANDGTDRVLSLSDGSANNRIVLYYNSSNNLVAQVYSISNNLQGTITVTDLNITENSKVAVKYETSSIKLYLNGFLKGTQSIAVSAINLSELDFDNGVGGANFYGKCKTVAVFKEALTDTELACLTSTNNREIFLNYYYRMQYVGANTEALSCAEQTFNV